MKIGKIVKEYIPKISHFCETVDHQEFENLLDIEYSKNTFNIRYPFYKETSKISKRELSHFYTQIHIIRGKTVKITNDWYDKNRSSFISYIISKKITSEKDLNQKLISSKITVLKSTNTLIKKNKNARYKGTAIGNASNTLVRNILSNLRNESFTKKDWQETINYFNNSCAYCGKKTNLVMEHIVPINRKSLGEHRLGNIIPSCKQCNIEKSDKSFIDFLDKDIDKIQKIQKYMSEKNYIPLTGNKQIEMILEIAYNEVSTVSNRYINILNELFSKNI